MDTTKYPAYDAKLHSVLTGNDGYYAYFKERNGFELRRVSNFTLTHKWEVEKFGDEARAAGFDVTLYLNDAETGDVTRTNVYNNKVVSNAAFATDGKFTKWLKDIDARLWFNGRSGRLDDLLVTVIRDDVEKIAWAELSIESSRRFSGT